MLLQAGKATWVRVPAAHGSPIAVPYPRGQDWGRGSGSSALLQGSWAQSRRAGPQGAQRRPWAQGLWGRASPRFRLALKGTGALGPPLLHRRPQHRIMGTWVRLGCLSSWHGPEQSASEQSPRPQSQDHGERWFGALAAFPCSPAPPLPLGHRLSPWTRCTSQPPKQQVPGLGQGVVAAPSLQRESPAAEGQAGGASAPLYGDSLTLCRLPNFLSTGQAPRVPSKSSIC